MCGSSSGQKSVAAGQSDFFTSLQTAYQKEFAGQNAILQSLTSAFTPILAAGPGQQGMTNAELNARNTAARNATSANYQAAARAVGSQLAARGGGNAYLPSGTEAGVKGDIAAHYAQELSQEQLGIQQENYALGRQQFGQAAGALSGAAGLYNPVGFAGQTTGAGNAAFGDYTQMNAQGNQWVGALGGALGGAMTGIGQGLGTRIGGGN